MKNHDFNIAGIKKIGFLWWKDRKIRFIRNFALQPKMSVREHFSRAMDSNG